ncbi:MAG: beta-galactosidase [Armatimonadetes bacterium]|nr:beta-galactosidase [Armatimonadota bacterium]
MQTPAGVLLVLTVLLAASAGAAEDKVLYGFEEGFKAKKLPARDAKVQVVQRDGHGALHVTTGHAQDWPGIDLPAAFGPWDLSAFETVSMDVRNVGASEVGVHLRVDNMGADGIRNCLTRSLTLKPDAAGTIEVPLARRAPGMDAIKLFGMRGTPFSMAADRTINPAEVVNLVVFVAKPQADHVFEISNVRAGGEYKPPAEVGLDAAQFFPFIDEFGQYLHREWPGKVHDVADFAARREVEAADLQAHAGPEDWDQYGGWKGGPQLEATGFFRPLKHEGKWWLVDPEGRLFWAHGVDCVTPWEGGTPLLDRDTWFRNLPAADGQFKGCYGGPYGGAVHGYYVGKKTRTFDFARANLMRKYGDDFLAPFADISHRRLRSWGLNTIANWSDANTYLQRKTPYTVNLWFSSKQLEGSQGYWGKFRDVFDPSFAAGIAKVMAGQAGKSANDPWCIGYFVDNELGWGDEVSLALAALMSPPEQAAKQAFVADLKAKYETIEKLNAAWGTQHASWDALAQSRTAPDKAKAGADLKAFYTRTAETYFQTIRDGIKAAAPQQLYLGCRFAWVNDRAAAAAAKFCDVLCYNLYRPSVADFKPAGGADVPLIIGEFHFGALDRGMFHTGLVPVASQEARAKAYRDYVQGALRNPYFVGTGWFKYMDEATTGRPLDEENYQIGFVDCCDTPYAETIAAVREVGYGMYRLRLEGK